MKLYPKLKKLCLKPKLILINNKYRKKVENMNIKFNPEYLAFMKELKEHVVDVCRTENHTSDKLIPILEEKVILDKEEMKEIVEKERKNKYAN